MHVCQATQAVLSQAIKPVLNTSIKGMSKIEYILHSHGVTWGAWKENPRAVFPLSSVAEPEPAEPKLF